MSTTTCLFFWNLSQFISDSRKSKFNASWCAVYRINSFLFSFLSFLLKSIGVKSRNGGEEGTKIRGISYATWNVGGARWMDQENWEGSKSRFKSTFGDVGKFLALYVLRKAHTCARTPSVGARSIFLLGVAGHTELRDASPLTYVASMSRSRARHRGPGDLISAILSLGKFRVSSTKLFPLLFSLDRTSLSLSLFCLSIERKRERDWRNRDTFIVKQFKQRIQDQQRHCVYD